MHTEIATEREIQPTMDEIVLDLLINGYVVVSPILAMLINGGEKVIFPTFKPPLANMTTIGISYEEINSFQATQMINLNRSFGPKKPIVANNQSPFIMNGGQERKTLLEINQLNYGFFLLFFNSVSSLTDWNLTELSPNIIHRKTEYSLDLIHEDILKSAIAGDLKYLPIHPTHLDANSSFTFSQNESLADDIQMSVYTCNPEPLTQTVLRERTGNITIILGEQSRTLVFKGGTPIHNPTPHSVVLNLQNVKTGSIPPNDVRSTNILQFSTN